MDHHGIIEEDEINDLYLQNISSSAGSPEQAQERLRNALEEYTVNKKWARDWGKITIVRIPRS